VSHVDKLKQAGLIHHQANLSQQDHDTINSLSDHEVDALISVKKKLPADFIKKHAGVDSPEPSASRSLGIVF